MFLRKKKITFQCHPDLLDVKEIEPKLSSHCLPDWYKKIKVLHHSKGRSIKSCMPFMDSMTAGYILPLPQDFYIEYNFYNEEIKKKDTGFRFSLDGQIDDNKLGDYNLNSSDLQIHSTDQLGGDNSYISKKNGSQAFLKILNPWKIITPPGYSCLFTSPHYNENDYWNIITAIVDTDTYEGMVNFPIVINHDKYPEFKKDFKQGMPYVQVIPFKRDSWYFKKESVELNPSKIFSYFSKFQDRYKRHNWIKKIWK